MSDLKPCPFCNGEAICMPEIDNIQTVECVDCGALVDGAEEWNTRYERTVKLKDNGNCPDCRKLVGTGER